MIGGAKTAQVGERIPAAPAVQAVTLAQPRMNSASEISPAQVFSLMIACGANEIERGSGMVRISKRFDAVPSPMGRVLKRGGEQLLRHMLGAISVEFNESTRTSRGKRMRGIEVVFVFPSTVFEKLHSAATNYLDGRKRRPKS